MIIKLDSPSSETLNWVLWTRIICHELPQVVLIILFIAKLFFLVVRELVPVIYIFIEKVLASREFLVQVVSCQGRIVSLVDSIVVTPKVPQESIFVPFSLQLPRKGRIVGRSEHTGIKRLQS